MNKEQELLKQLEEANKLIEKMEEEHRKELQKKDLEMFKINKKLEEALLIIAAFEEKYKIERTKVFIPKTEKIDKIVINETEEILKEEKEEKVEKKTNKGKKYKTKPFDFEKYVTETKIIESSETICPECGELLTKVSEKVRYVVEVTPPKINVTKIIKVTRKCPKCNKENGKIYYPLSDDVFPGSILTPSFAAFVAYSKYELGIPFNHLSNHITNNIGFDISKQNLANYMAKLSKVLEPIYDHMKSDLLNNKSKVIHSDETTLVVSKKDDEESSRKKSYVYVYASSFFDEKQIRIYDFQETRSIEATKKWLNNYDGVIECDSFVGYDKLKRENPNIKLQKCWAHVRRRFADIVKNLKPSERKKSKAYQILLEIKKLFALESSYKKQNLIPDSIVSARAKDIPSIKESIYNLVFNANPVKNSALYGAIEYTKSCWEDLFTFLDNGYVEICNNLAERAVKPFVVQRKVFQTAGSYAGARYTSKIFSIIQTCLINNINVEGYLKYVLENINKMPVEELLPYSKEMAFLVQGLNSNMA